MKDWPITEWRGCYPSKWKGMIVPEAMKHPAKFSSLLIRRIYQHLIAEGWLKPGDMVIDPFGGVALGALDAMRVGIRWRGIELEPRFAYGEDGEDKVGDRTYQPHTQGTTPGQLGDMPDRGLDGAVTSPPYEAQEIANIPGSGTDIELRRQLRASGEWEGYNRDNTENLGSNEGENFWMAARQIVEQVYMVLAPGAHAVWVVKDFVKDNARVPFCDQWRQLCEAVGFTTVHEHHAMLVHDRGASMTLDGGTIKHKKESKSFFRRNIETTAKAKEFWNSGALTREQQGHFLRAAHRIKWDAYYKDVVTRPEIRKPHHHTIMGKAQSLAYVNAGRPDIDIAVSVDYEVVLCMAKGEA